MFFSLIIRNGLSDFFEFTKSFCNFHINILAAEPYVIEIKKILENKFGIKFQKFKGRKKEKENKKFLKDLNLDFKNTIIFDDNPGLWVKDYSNVIISKKFTDKEINYYFLDNRKNENDFLYNYFPFYYFKSKKNEFNQIKWKNQKLYGGRQCPFYKFNENNNIKDNDCYSGEYLNSSKYQFIYMKDIIKILYYLLFNYNISISEILKLIRYNIFFEIYFNLKFYKGEGEGKYILKDIIENCGGEIIEENKNNISNNNNKKIFYVCKKEDYSVLKYKIKKE